MKIKKLLTNIFLCSALIVGLNSQPVGAVEVGRKSAFAALAVVGGALGFHAAKRVKKALLPKKPLQVLSEEEQEKLRKEEERKKEEEQRKADARFGNLFNFVYSRCNVNGDIEGFDPIEKNAQFIFEQDLGIVRYIADEDRSDWNSRISFNPFGESGRKKIIREFKEYSTKKRKDSIFIHENGEKYVRAGYERVEDMISAYLEYLNKPVISKKDVVVASTAILANQAINSFTDIPTKISSLIKRFLPWPLSS